jgi:hypothetical protein
MKRIPMACSVLARDGTTPNLARFRSPALDRLKFLVLWNCYGSALELTALFSAVVVFFHLRKRRLLVIRRQRGLSTDDKAMLSRVAPESGRANR